MDFWDILIMYELLWRSLGKILDPLFSLRSTGKGACRFQIQVFHGTIYNFCSWGVFFQQSKKCKFTWTAVLILYSRGNYVQALHAFYGRCINESDRLLFLFPPIYSIHSSLILDGNSYIHLSFFVEGITKTSNSTTVFGHVARRIPISPVHYVHSRWFKEAINN